ncbi:LYR motif containing protein 1 [Bulinus truncatus]|nr:LYR motif containing protein 1 [Bulinus truncatus]
MTIFRNEVLSLYKQILRMSKFWKSSSAVSEAIQAEKRYIAEEASKLFRKNKSEISNEKIKEHIREAQTRIGLALHYGNPYPRMMNIPQNTLAPNRTLNSKKDQKIFHQATPVYLRSYQKNLDSENRQ